MAPLAPDVLVGVVGGGTMGAGIAQVAAVAGHPVVIHDAAPGRAQEALAGIRARLVRLVDKGRLDERAARAVSVAAADGPGDLAGAGLVLEAVVESLDVKRDVFLALEDIVGDDCLLATNTSSLSVTAIGAALRCPQRLVGMHFFNPAPVMPLVEVVSGLATDPMAARAAFDTAGAWGKTPVRARSTPGFVVNRVARPFYAEALRAYEAGAASASTIDAVLTQAGGFRMGPLALTDLIGQDVNAAVTRSVWEAFGHDPRYTPSVAQQMLVEAGRLGRKTGRGFYDHTGTEAPPQAATAAGARAPDAVRVIGALGPLAALVVRAQAAGVAVASPTAPTEHSALDGIVALPSGGSMRLTDGRMATDHAARDGHPVVLVDLALDYDEAPRVAVAACHGCPPATLAEAVGLLQAAGKAVSVVDDVPGLLVMRTVASLVNAAADAVEHGVASAEDVDIAMRQGVNYPLGPLEWGDRLGAATVVRVLDNLAAAHSDGRYRVSPWLRRRALARAGLR